MKKRHRYAKVRHCGPSPLYYIEFESYDHLTNCQNAISRLSNKLNIKIIALNGHVRLGALSKESLIYLRDIIDEALKDAN